MGQDVLEGLQSLNVGLGAEAGAALAAHGGIGSLTFTGSVETGKIIYRAAAEKLPVSATATRVASIPNCTTESSRQNTPHPGANVTR